ncbi:MAG: TetR/AcrR family transcriptional regulator [Acidobacteriota bacterium]|nr:TetR/AcrR family transcriptional regulator [Acidobacteriota bacterium]
MNAAGDKTDRRARRTRQSLNDALIRLILEKRYDSITVQDVIDRAGVARSTFYAHYRDKDDLFLQGWRSLLDMFARSIAWDDAGRRQFVPLLKLLLHVRDSHNFYRALVRSRKTAMLFRTGHAYLSESSERSLESWLADKPRPPLPVPLVADYLAGEVMSLLKWWLDHDMPYTPERMAEMFHQLVGPGVRAALSDAARDAE